MLHYNGGQDGGWTEVPGWGIDIAVDPGINLPLVVTRDGSVYNLSGT